MSSNPKRRLWYHNHKSQGYTKQTDDWSLQWSKKFQTKREALQCENSIKDKKSRKYIELLISGKIVIQNSG